VTQAQFTALYGPGGAKDPTTGQRLVSTTRPDMELVIAAHKSVAEQGVIGRAEDMHASWMSSATPPSPTSTP